MDNFNINPKAVVSFGIYIHILTDFIYAISAYYL